MDSNFLNSYPDFELNEPIETLIGAMEPVQQRGDKMRLFQLLWCGAAFLSLIVLFWFLYQWLGTVNTTEFLTNFGLKGGGTFAMKFRGFTLASSIFCFILWWVNRGNFWGWLTTVCFCLFVASTVRWFFILPRGTILKNLGMGPQSFAATNKLIFSFITSFFLFFMWKRTKDRVVDDTKIAFVKELVETLADILGKETVLELSFIGGRLVHKNNLISKDAPLVFEFGRKNDDSESGEESEHIESYDESSGNRIYQQSWFALNGPLKDGWEFALELFEQARENLVFKGISTSGKMETVYRSQNGINLTLQPPPTKRSTIETLNFLRKETFPGNFVVNTIKEQDNCYIIKIVGDDIKEIENVDEIEDKSNVPLAHVIFYAIDQVRGLTFDIRN
ncbi:hypothetical protein ACFL35_04200 [Candidatus Riflebacteria bacterium]